MRFVFSFICVLSACLLYGQPGYKIQWHVTGWKDTTVFLGYSQAESHFLKDTARINSTGEFVFDGVKALPEGMYFLVVGRNKMIDFVVGKQQHFSMATDTQDFVKHMKITGDEDNKLFFENQLFLADRHVEADPLLKIIQDSTLHDDAKKKEAREAFSKINDKVVAYQEGIIAKHPETVTARIFKSSKQVQIPPAPRKADGTIDSTFQLRWYRQHFFDNFDLADDALLHQAKTPYQDKIKEYLEKLFLPIPDSVTKAIEFVVARAKKNPETYKHAVYICTFLYQQPEIMGLDQVFVNIYNKYYATGEMDYWANAQLRKNLKEMAEKISRAQIGTVAPNLIMQDINLQPKSLYDIKKKYTIVYFFDPDCGHCRIETPKLVSFYAKEKQKYNLEVFAVATDTSMKKLRDYIKEMKMEWITVDGPRTYINTPFTKLYFAETFPTVYILDEQKKVIARKLPVEKIDVFLAGYERSKKSKNAAPGAKGF